MKSHVMTVGKRSVHIFSVNILHENTMSALMNNTEYRIYYVFPVIMICKPYII